MTSPPPSYPAAESPLTLPVRPSPAPARGVPWLACAVPVAGALGFWVVTGSVFALWFAFLGPLIAIASVADGWRTALRVRRTGRRSHAEALSRVRGQIDARHRDERAGLAARHPDVARHLARGDGIWRAVPDRDGVLLLGAGELPSAARITVPGDAAPEDRDLARSASILTDAPLVTPLGSGVALVGPPVAADAVIRAFVLQLALTHPPGRLQVVAESAAGHEWVRALPHTFPAPLRVVIGEGAREDDATLVFTRLDPGAALPPRCPVVVVLTGPTRARVEIGAETRPLAVEAVGEEQASRIARDLSARASALADTPAAEATVALTPLLRSRSTAAGGLAVQFGRGSGEPFSVDLVRDGPHAVITGMTGSGKSELLTSWIVALCAAYGTADVSFVLADFKGGTAFDALAGLPHVTGVVTDLDPQAARRAIDSLRAEIRYREAALTRQGARDVSDTDLGRLVIVVDEFAALRDAHPEAEALFVDIAARGRALGMHLVLGTQRADGALREGLRANCPLRICLRVADRTDSLAVVGVGDAADLPGGDAGRGLALIRRAGDARPHTVRIALAVPDDLVAAARDAGPAPRRPWLPPLPPRIPLAELVGDREPGLVVGVRDDPDRQAQDVWRLDAADRGLLTVGGVGSGATTVLHAIAAQIPADQRRWIGPDPEQLWDALSHWPEHGVRTGTAVFLDDLDALASSLPDEYARAATDALERLVRAAGSRGMRVFATAHHLHGPAARLADLFPRRLILGTASRADHIAAGGVGADFVAGHPPGRGSIDGRTIQVAWTEAVPVAAAPDAPDWSPPPGLCGVVRRRDGGAARRAWERDGIEVRDVDAPGDPEPARGARALILGDADQWLLRPRVLDRVRHGHPLVIDAAYDREFRLLTGERALPPYADPGRGRAWECLPGRSARRVTLRAAVDP